MNSVVRPRARDDVMRQFRWYLVEQQAPVAAFRFLDAVEDSVEQLRRMPEIGAPKMLSNAALTGLRVWPVKGFEEIGIYYTVRDEILKVVRLLHGKRDIKRILQREPVEEDID